VVDHPPPKLGGELGRIPLLSQEGSKITKFPSSVEEGARGW